MPNPSNGETIGTTKILELIVESLRIIIWPFIVIILLFIYHEPVGILLDSLSSKFSEANRVSIGSLSFEIEKQLKKSVDHELVGLIGHLSPKAVESLLLTPRDSYIRLLSDYGDEDIEEVGLPNESEMSALRELEYKGLIKFSIDLDEFMGELMKLQMIDPTSVDQRVTFKKKRNTRKATMAFLLEQDYTLTEAGREASEAIIKAVVTLLENE